MPILEYPAPHNRYQAFSSATNKIEGKTLIWRYLTFEKFVWMLETSGLYHARLDQLEDRLEGSVTKLFAANREKEYGSANPHVPSAQAFFNRRGLIRSYVNCWHSSEHESAAMWKVYSGQNAGVAITSTLDRLYDSVILPPETEYGLLGPVEYFDFETHSMKGPTGCMALPGFAKQKSFEFEREVRAMICINPDPESTTIPISPEYLNGLKDKTPLGVVAKAELKQLIAKIYTSPFSQPWFKEIVQNAANRAGLGDVVYQSSLVVDPIY